MARYNQKQLLNDLALFQKMAEARLKSLAQDADEDTGEDEEDTEYTKQQQVMQLRHEINKLTRQLKRIDPEGKYQGSGQGAGQLKQRSPQVQQQRQQEQTQKATKTPEQIIIYDGLNKEIYSEIAPAGQALKGKFNQGLFTEITKIFNEELFYHATIGRGDRDQMRKMVASNRIRLAITINAATNQDNAPVSLQFWSTDPSFRQKFPKQTAAAEQRLSQLLVGPVSNSIQSIAQTSGLTEPTKNPIRIHTYISVADNNDTAEYTQL